MCCIPEVFGLGKVWLSGSTVRDSPCHVGGAHFSARAQERLLKLAIADNASVSELESLFVQMTLAECRRQVAPVAPGLMNNPDHAENPNALQRNRAEIPSAYPDSCWEVLDSIDLEEVF